MGSAPDWSIRITSHMSVVARHQYGISALVAQTSFRGETLIASRNVRCFLVLAVFDQEMMMR